MISGGLPPSVGSGTPPSPNWMLSQWALGQAFTISAATRNTNEAITTASVVWPDGATGTYTADILSASFPGAVDAYHVTYVWSAGTKTITQAAVTRDSSGAVTAQPAPTVA